MANREPQHAGEQDAEPVDLTDESAALDTEIAEAASRLLPKLVKDHIQVCGGKISLADMKVMLKYAVDLGSAKFEKWRAEAAEQADRTQRVEQVEQVATAVVGLADDIVEETDGSACVAVSADFRGKGWLKLHKASQSVRAVDDADFKATQRAVQSLQSVGAIGGEEPSLEESWAAWNKRRSKQHGGTMWRRKRPGVLRCP